MSRARSCPWSVLFSRVPVSGRPPARPAPPHPEPRRSRPRIRRDERTPFRMRPNPLWFVDRSAGEVTLVLLTCVMLLGILRSALPSAYPRLVESLHTNLALLAIAFGVGHVLAAVLDPFAHLGLVDALVPFGSVYRRTWLGLGVVSGYLIAAVVLTSWPARRLSRGIWLWVHRTMYAGWM